MFHEQGESWAREAAALSVLPAAVLAPRLLAVAADPPLVVMSDLGNGASVADALLGADAVVAGHAVIGWAGALAGLHASTASSGSDFRRALAGRAPTVQPSRTPQLLATAAKDIEQLINELGITAPSRSLEHLRTMLRDDLEHCALTPADACPDNNVSVAAGLALLDFEGAEYRHLAWDAAYLLVPWPSCWCSWRLPEDVSDRALAHYRDSLAPVVPYIATPQFEADLVRAGIGWALLSTARLSANALGADPPSSDPRIVAPSRRAMILHRLAAASAANAHAVEPQLAAVATRLRAEFVGRWGEIPLPFAPAYR